MQGTDFKIIHLQTLPVVQPRNRYFKGEQSLWDDFRTTLTYQANCKATSYAAFDNGFFAAFLQAYNNHGDVKITPDDVWIAIMLYFSKYVNDNAEQLRKAFVSHQGKRKLTVVTQKQLSENEWDEFFTLMIAAIKKNTNEGVVERFQSNFSTTGRVQRILSTATIMNTYQKFFSYERMIPMCGIQNVHFGGTLQDWKSVFTKTKGLLEFDLDGKLKRYVKNVCIILEKFIDTYQGKVDLDFWNHIIDIKEGRLGSGSTKKYSGWLIHFFGFEGEVTDVTIPTISFDIEIDNRMTGIVKNVTLKGGFKAISSEGSVHRPHLSMTIKDYSQLK